MTLETIFQFDLILGLENQLRAIDPKLFTYVLLGKSNSQTKFRFSLILGLATRGQNQNHKSAITPQLKKQIKTTYIMYPY
jgi:hypothetical protein